LFVTPTTNLSYVTVYSLKQTVNLTNGLAAGEIDAGQGSFAFSAWLASYGTPNQNPEQSFLALRFFDDSGTNQIGTDFFFDRATRNSWIGNAGSTGIVPLPDALTNAPGLSNHHWAKYRRSSIVPQGSRKATVYITRSPNAALSGSPDTYVDLVKLDVRSVNPQPPVLETAFPANDASGIDPNVIIKVTLRDGTTSVSTNSIGFLFDGQAVSSTVSKSGPLTSIAYHSPQPLAGNSTHSYVIVFDDNGVPTTTQTNQFQFIVAPAPPVPAAIFPPDHVVVLMDENRTYGEIIGNTNDAPYLNSLLPFAANLTRSVAEQHPTDPNYLYFFSGADQGITDNSIPGNLPFTTPNLAAELISAGLTFVDYAEDLPFTGDLTPVVNGPDGTYYEEENVAGYWISTNSPPPSTNNLPPTTLQPLSNWPQNFLQLPTIAFVHSVEQNDMHQGYWPTDSSTIQNGDTWIRNHLDAYIQWAMTNNSLFILTFDESYTVLEDPNLYNHIPTLFVGPMIKPGNYSEAINHFNVLRTLEDMYHLTYAGADATADPITDIWLPPQLRISLLPGGRIRLGWPGRAILQTADYSTGPYRDVTNGIGPYETMAPAQGFYRLKSP
jgi:hypothetical protein